jgi:hypothetical protein
VLQLAQPFPSVPCGLNTKPQAPPPSMSCPPKKIRDYGDVVDRLKKISRRHNLVLHPIGETAGYRHFLLSSNSLKPAARPLYLSAGTHGDEPAAVEGLLQWLERGEWRKKNLNLFILPCINPWGYEHNRRENRDGLDINRQFRLGGCAEAHIVMRVLRGRRFDLGVELHEDIDSPGFYMYEIKSEPPYLGEKIVSAVLKHGPVNRSRIIEGAKSKGGVIRPPNFTSKLLRRKKWPLAFFLYSYHTPHKLTFETPGPCPFDVRVAQQVAALDAAT